VLRALAQATAPMRRRIAMMVSRGVVRRVDDRRKLQELQVSALAGEVLAGAERFQQYGFSSVPLEGAEVVVVFAGGARSHPLVVSADDRTRRPRDQPAGDVSIYTDQDDPEQSAEDAEHRIQMTRERSIVVRAEKIDLRCGPARIVMDETGVTITTPRLDIVRA